MQEIGITPKEQEMIDDMSALSNKLVPLEDEAMKNVQAGKTKKRLTMFMVKNTVHLLHRLTH